MIEDPFQEARENDGVLPCPFQGEVIPMLLRHSEVRAAAKDWEAFSSDAPFRVPIPSEEEMRTMRQLPIETNPPEHGEYRKIVEPFFKRAKLPEVVAQVEGLIDELLRPGEMEVVSDLALPVQSRALTYLLNVEEAEAETYIGWGVHVFHDDGEGAPPLEVYLQERLDRAEAGGGEDFFAALTKAELRGRSLTREEMMGFANLTFAGGRDTIIHSISSVMAWFAEHPEGLNFLKEDPKRITLAAEEFFRVFMPLTHIGRVCPVATEVGGAQVPADGRVSLGWAAANLDGEVFEEPLEVKLDRKPNPHLAFGFGTHLCLGAAHARLIVRSLLKGLCDKVGRIEVLEGVRHVEKEAAYERKNGYDRLRVLIV